jgi:hypothetical protein
VLLEMNVQHSPPIRTRAPPLSARIMSRAVQLSHAVLLAGLVVLQFPSLHL